ncbi:MAG: diadenylate cyclase CdaA [Planctomycetales bacterium]|nr:diadenylate cyclase CdaA [Planctomycetales bacterium]
MGWGAVFADVVDLGIVSFLLYRLLLLIRGTRAIPLLQGAAVLIGVILIARLLGLSALSAVFVNVGSLTIIVLGAVVLFAPEIRRALARLAAAGERFGRARVADPASVAAVAQAAEDLARDRVGAIIAVQRAHGLAEIADTGVAVDAQATPDLLRNLFWPGSPLHDGAAIVRGDRVVAARCVLPLSEQADLDRLGIGTRHRAAVGLSEQSDALVVVVSEETGKISLAFEGKLRQGLGRHELEDAIRASLGSGKPAARGPWWEELRKNPGWRLAALGAALLVWGPTERVLQADVALAVTEGPGSVVRRPERRLTARLDLTGSNFGLLPARLDAWVRPATFRDAFTLDARGQDAPHTPEIEPRGSYGGVRAISKVKVFPALAGEWDPRARTRDPAGRHVALLGDLPAGVSVVRAALGHVRPPGALPWRGPRDVVEALRAEAPPELATDPPVLLTDRRESFRKTVRLLPPAALAPWNDPVEAEVFVLLGSGGAASASPASPGPVEALLRSHEESVRAEEELMRARADRESPRRTRATPEDVARAFESEARSARELAERRAAPPAEGEMARETAGRALRAAELRLEAARLRRSALEAAPAPDSLGDDTHRKIEELKKEEGLFVTRIERYGPDAVAERAAAELEKRLSLVDAELAAADADVTRVGQERAEQPDRVFLEQQRLDAEWNLARRKRDYARKKREVIESLLRKAREDGR